MNKTPLNFFHVFLELLLLIVAGIVTLYFLCEACFKENHTLTFYASIYSISLWVSHSYGQSWISHLIDKKIGWLKAPIKCLLIGLVAMFFYSLLCLVVINGLAQWGFNFNTGFFTFKGFWVAVAFSAGVSLLMNLILHGAKFLRSWRETAVQGEKLKAQHLSSQYQSLKNQVNPEFLFDSLNVLTDLVYKDQDQADKFIVQLSQVYRYVLESRKNEVVLLKDELAFLQSFLFIQKMRFGDNLRFRIDIPEESTIGITPQSLQILVENAIQHNFISSDQPLLIEIFDDKEGFIQVRNNLQEKKNKSSVESSGIGLEKIKNQYEFLSNKMVEVLEEDDVFTVKIPVIKFDNP
ncbi:sensor histidine kinase [Xanthovirga aplysinae]|uniref:sensor histidine kinase n=1 Tax=Xanthovirga aplysinae TaxID=2529853 RepID=UPI0012BC2E7E|nr:histidine kinase [Xanthovirga aplysinae]MTI32619.1 hypothetical protein [Xanthovirga aplysinae]